MGQRFSKPQVPGNMASEAEPPSEKSSRSKAPCLPKSSPCASSREEAENPSAYGSVAESPWVRCVYFTQVRAVKGVVVEWFGETKAEPKRDKPLVLEAELSQESTLPATVSVEDTLSLVSALEPFQEESETCTQELNTQQEEAQERPRAATPERMVTCEWGLQCMACCRIFTSWESLKEHAEHGVNQGFSCRVFYEEMLERKLEPPGARRPWRSYMRRLLRRELGKVEETCRDLEKQLAEAKRLKRKLLMLEKEEARCGASLRGKRQKTQ